MSFFQGIDFRATSTYVTDPSGYTYSIATAVSYPTTTPQGYTVGWEQSIYVARDRSASVDPRLAGIADVYGSTANFRVDLPAAGSYAIQAAFGDDAYATGPCTIEILDTSTVLATPVNNASISAANWVSANGVTRTATTWPTNNPDAGSGADEITLTFSTTILRVNLTAPSAKSAAISSLLVRAVGGASIAGFGRAIGVGMGYAAASLTIAANGRAAGVGMARSVGTVSIASAARAVGIGMARGAASVAVSAAGRAIGVGTGRGGASLTIAAAGRSAGMGAARGASSVNILAYARSAAMGAGRGVLNGIIGALGRAIGIGQGRGVLTPVGQAPTPDEIVIFPADTLSVTFSDNTVTVTFPNDTTTITF